jgi:hypothetical protein
VGADRSGARRSGRVLLGMYAVRLLVLGAPRLAAFPAAELTWMALSPIALASLVAGAATAVRRAELSPALLRFEGRLGIAS